MGLLGNIGLSVAGNLVSSFGNSLFGRSSAKYNAGLARDNWAYQQGNAHQLEVSDLRAAGLNPILSATNSQIAGMGSVSGQNGSSDGLGSTVFSALVQKEIAKTNAEIAKTNAETERIKAGIYGNDDSAAKERFTAGTENLKADTSEKNSAKSLNDAQSAFVNLQGKEMVRLNDVNIEHIRNQIANESRLTDAQISRIETQKAVDMATVNTLAANARQAIAQSELSDKEKESIQRDLDSYTRKLADLTAEERYKLLKAGSRGENATGILNKAGFVMDLLNPFGSIGTTIGSFRVGGHK